MRIDPDIITLLFHPEGATADELAAVTEHWVEQVEHLMQKNEITRFMDKEGNLCFRWKRREYAGI